MHFDFSLQLEMVLVLLQSVLTVSWQLSSGFFLTVLEFYLCSVEYFVLLNQMRGGSTLSWQRLMYFS